MDIEPKISRVFAALILSLFVVFARNAPCRGEQTDPNVPLTESVPVNAERFPDRVDPGSEGRCSNLVEGADGLRSLAYRGFLSDEYGTPFDGMFDVTASLCGGSRCDEQVWGPETFPDVVFADGEFELTLGQKESLPREGFDSELYLLLEMEAYAIDTCRAVRIGPFEEETQDLATRSYDGASHALLTRVPSIYGLQVVNESEGATGLYVVGDQYGIYAEETGYDSDIGIYTPDYVHALGYRSASDSYIFVPATSGVLASNGDSEITVFYYGRVGIKDPTPGTEYYYIPITVPGELFGQATTVESIRVHYRTSDSTSYIDRTSLHRATSSGSHETLIDDGTNRSSTTDTYYTLTAAGETTFSSASGPLQVQLQLHFDSASHTIYIGFVRAEFGHLD